MKPPLLCIPPTEGGSVAHANENDESIVTHLAPGQTRVRAGRPLPYVSSPGLSWGGAVRRCVSPELKSAACTKELVRLQPKLRTEA